MDKISFLQYLDAKRCLREAIKINPVVTVLYEVKKYCRISVGSSKDEKQYIQLKPKQQLIVEWLYGDNCEDTPHPNKVTIADPSPIDHNIFYDGEKMQKWLITNTRESS